MKRLRDDDLAVLMEGRLSSLRAFTVLAPQPSNDMNSRNATTEKAAESKMKSEDKVDSTQKKESKSRISSELHDYLQSIYERPYLSTIQRAALFGYSAYMHDKVKKEAISGAYAEELAINFGHKTRGNVKFLELTANGYKALGLAVPSLRPKNCSPEHFWYQKAICAWYRGKGFDAHIEYCLLGKNADVGVIGKGRVIAIEVAMSPKNEVRNAIADLEAGFDEVRILAKNAAVKSAIDEALSSALMAEQLSHVTTALLSDGAFLKDILNS